MNDIEIEVTQECIDSLQSHIQESGDEDCGVLMCSQISDNKIRINKVSASCRRSSSTTSCELDLALANEFIKVDYEQSNHTRCYIGEWHTHPEDNPSPSFVDLSSLKSSFKNNKLAVRNVIVMAIVGRKNIYWGIYDGNNYKSVTPKIV